MYVEVYISYIFRMEMSQKKSIVRGHIVDIRYLVNQVSPNEWFSIDFLYEVLIHESLWH